MGKFYGILGLAVIAIVGLTLPTMAQDTCKTYTVANPHGAAMDITKIWAIDTVNFTVNTVRTLPFNIGATESFDIVVCLRVLDGKSHTTQIRYTNTHGTSSYSVTMTAPSTSSVDPERGAAKSLALRLLSPNPAGDRITVGVDNNVVGDLHIAIYSMTGDMARSLRFESYGSSLLNLDLRGLPSGMYTMVVTDAASRTSSMPLVVAR